MSLTIAWSNTDEAIPRWTRYQVVQNLGCGAHATVWRARDTLSGRECAIKQFHLGAPCPHQECSLLAGVRHSGIPRLYELFQERGRWHLVMEYVAGDTLRTYRRVHGGVLPVEEVRDIGVQLAAIVDELHTQDPVVLYRDLKPANIIRMTSGRVRLVDFGSACSDYNNDYYAMTPYASPEQRLRCEAIDERADIYSLGVVLYELLTGRIDFEMESYEDEVSERLRMVLLSMVAYDPDKRPQNMVDVMLMLLRG